MGLVDLAFGRGQTFGQNLANRLQEWTVTLFHVEVGSRLRKPIDDGIRVSEPFPSEHRQVQAFHEASPCRRESARIAFDQA